MTVTGRELARLIDHTLLKAEAEEEAVKKLCREARKHNFASVCVNPFFVPIAAAELAESTVKVCTVIGFPLGATTWETKVHEACRAVQDGAGEIDMVINIGALKSGNTDVVKREIREVVAETTALAPETIVKVIIETCYLTDEEKVTACMLAREAGAHFVKTSTGFGTGGATVQDVRLLRHTVGVSMGVKASGGIRTYEDAVAMIEAGATRIGASAGVKIIAEAPN
ncbi:MAG: deoxyribose-phosphate aldolase [Thermoanaerobacteraceae bacterium]|nr:deoxyribose-phosphate aldolase [Thermoanaerobacteraceae bacterium]